MTVAPVTGRDITPADYNEFVSAYLAGGGLIDLDTLPYVTPEQYGAVGDFVTDDTAAFTAAEAAAAATGRYVALKSPRYYLASGFNAHKPVFWLGSGGNAALGDGGTIIRVGNNVNGWVANKGNTHGDGLGSQGDSSGGKIQGIAFYGGNITVNGAGAITSYSAGDSSTGHGVRIRSTFYECEDVLCAFFGQDGFNIDCSAGSGGSTEGNANNFRMTRCQAIYNGRYGLLTNGTDANAGQIDTFSAIACAGAGIAEYSFLGNTYNMFHIRDCGFTDATGCNNPVGVCLYGGNRYVAAADQLVAASTTTPGTNSAIWIPAPFAGGANKTWVSGQTWIVGSPVATNPSNTNARNVFTGCYCESAQGPIQAFYPTMFVGGLLDEAGFTSTSTSVWLKVGPRILTGAECFRTSTVGSTYSASLGSPNAPYIWATITDGVSVGWSMSLNGSGDVEFAKDGAGIPAKITSNGIKLGSGKALYDNSGAQVVGAQGAAVAADATDLASALTLVNQLKARLRTHGLIA